MKQTIVKYLKRKIVWIPLVLVIIGGFIYFRSGEDAKLDTISAERRDIVQEVSVTGKVEPAEDVELAFEKSGKVSYVNARVGASVGAGQLLVQLENADLAADLAQAQASVKTEQAKLDELKRGTRSEELEVQQVKVANAKVSLEDARRNLVNVIKDAYTKANDTVYNKVDQLFSNPRAATPKLTFNIGDYQLQIDIEDGRVRIEKDLTQWARALSTLSTSSDFDAALRDSKTYLDDIKGFVDDIAFGLNRLTGVSQVSQATFDSWKADIATTRTTINTAISNIASAEEKLRTAQSSLALAEQELTLKRAGTTPEQITAQEAQLERAVANIRSIEAQIAKTVIRAPIGGVITKQDAKIGEIVTAGSPVVSMIGSAGFEIEANVPEADIAKVKVGNTSAVTLDAYGDDVRFDAKVVEVDPAETIVDGVPTYKVTLHFLQKDDRIKSGMTANLDILTDKREGVIAIPQRAITTKDGKRVVRVLNEDGSYRETEVTTGIRGSDGNIEITNGISAGDTIVLSLEN